MSGHYYYSFSGAYTWSRCTMAPRMAQLFPEMSERDPTEAAEGIATHWWSEQVMRALGDTTRVPPSAPNGVVFTDEMRESGQVYVDEVLGTVARYPDAVWGIETPLPARSIHPTLCGGTPDAWMYSAAARLVVAFQFKHGHREVTEFENPQEALTLSALVDHLKLDDQKVSAEIRIIQPRCFTSRGQVRTWRIGRLANLRPLWNRLHRIAEEGQLNPKATSGNHCFYCPGRHACPAARDAAMSSLDYTHQPLPEPLTADAMSFELAMCRRASKAVEARLTGLEEAAKGMIRRGTIIPGYGLAATTGRLAWREGVPPPAIDALGAMYGVEVRKPPQFITPTQAKALGIDESVIMSYASRSEGGLRLTEQTPDHIRRVLAQHSNSED